jgi:hypothetical protein
MAKSKQKPTVKFNDGLKHAIIALRKAGFNEREIEEQLGLNFRSIYGYKKNHPEFKKEFESCLTDMYKKNHPEFKKEFESCLTDITTKIMESMVKRAIGQTTVTTKKTFKRDKETKEWQDVIKEETITEHQGDLRAQERWLSKHGPEAWKESENDTDSP